MEFVNSRQCQQRAFKAHGKFSSTKSNHWDFHLIDIVFKINYVVYVHLTEDEDEGKKKKENFSLFRFSLVAYCFKRRRRRQLRIQGKEIKRKIDFSLNVKEGHVSRLLSGWVAEKEGEDFFPFSRNDEMW